MGYKILLVGTGLTSSLTGALIRKYCPTSFKLIAWDKAKGTGGRMSTSRHADSNSSADLGAQYITGLPENLKKHKDFYNSLINLHLIEPLSANVVGMREFPEGTQHFVIPDGSSSVIKHFLTQFDKVQFEHHVTSITEENNKWLVSTQNGHKETFDIVILTMPAPQILQLGGSVREKIKKDPSVENGLKSVKYSSRYALGLFYNAKIEISEPWDVKYIYDDEIFRYVAIDNKKRNRPDSPPAIVLHTTITYGEDNVERNIGDVQSDLLDHVKKVFPGWPEPDFVKCQKWRYSQVVTPYPGDPGFIIVQQDPLLIACGDGFTRSTVDGCVVSAENVANYINTIKDIGG